MSAKSKKLREERANIATKMREVADRANDPEHQWSSEDEQEWTRINKDYDAKTAEIEREERLEEVEGETRARSGDEVTEDVESPATGDGRSSRQSSRSAASSYAQSQKVDPETRALAMQAWMRASYDLDLREDHVEACRTIGVSPNRPNFGLPLYDQRRFRAIQTAFRQARLGGEEPEALYTRALNTLQSESGGALVPDDFVNQLEVNMLAFGQMLAEIDVMRTGSGGDMPWPTADDTANEGEIVGQNKSHNSADPTMGEVVFRAHPFSSKFIKVPFALLEDSAVDLAGYVSQAAGERLGRHKNRKFTVGGGNNEPRGIVKDAGTVSAAAAGSISADDLFDLEHGVDPAYREQNPVYMLHDDILLKVRKLKDNENRYLFQDDVRQGAPSTINGRRYVINQHMDNTVSSGKKTIGFGNLRKYKSRQVNQVRLKRLDERFADLDQVAFIALVRCDGRLLDAGTSPFAVLKH